MPKFRILVATLAVMLLLLPTVALAQPNVCGFYGSVTFDDEPVADGTIITALVDNEEVASATTEDSQYSVKVACDECAGKTVSFSMQSEEETVVVATGDWVAGANTSLDISGATKPTTCDASASIELKPASGVATNVVGTCFFTNRPIAITINGAAYSTVTSDVNGSFNAPLIPTSGDTGSITIAASDDMGRTDTETFQVEAAAGSPGPVGPEGAEGPVGPAGPAGVAGEDGSDAGSVLAIVALIIAIVAVILSIVFMMRGKQEAAA